MKWALRLLLCSSLFLLFPIFLLKAHLADLSDQYGAKNYLVNWLNLGWSDRGIGTYPVSSGDKVVVVAKLQEEHTEWIEEELPDWERAIYTVNPSHEIAADDQQLKTPLNKAYLIEHYNRLPSTIVFLHAHRSGFLRAWHVDAPLHDNVWAVRALQLNFVQQIGYANLRCKLNPGCINHHNDHVTREIFTDIFEGTSTPPRNYTDVALTSNQKYLYIPNQIAAACCAQFAVSRQQVLERPREDYIKIRQWIIDTNLDDAHSGRVMEFLWHMIFGKESV
ncbi:hypothetical protein ASPBRDRAFT_58380 [Aspergillus brasiliensis CBS 101740]|uniref:DUF3431 domain-containing protein n=1 Tax=Aspergillus brasiliensis (strain CBS 101740 / IMI 381727 / IBT 21946) TaxID=767769 RepID=A0A1L9U9J2_ASPBC|nr:hypothetical protein ASPBRDRAFT_58380 [Aspergillus brasiliensis CBS 101740]